MAENKNESNVNSGGRMTFFQSGFGVLVGLFSGVLTAFSNLCIVVAEDGGASQFQVAFLNAAVGLIIFAFVMCVKRVAFIPEKWKDRGFVTLNGVLHAVSGLGLLYALPRAPVGNVVTIVIGSMPIVTALFACVCLKERPRWFVGVGILIDVTGIILVSKPEFIFGRETGTSVTSQEGIAYFLAFLAAVGLSTTYICGRIVGPTVNPLATTFFVDVFISIVNAIFMIFSRTSEWNLSGVVWVALAGVIVTGNLGEWARYRSLQIEGAPTVVLLGNIQLVFVYILQITILHESSDLLDIIGAALVLLAATIVAIGSWRVNAKRQTDEENIQLLTSK
ncbi:solute carrier family 35 member G1-like [Ptychodera flava]|uniref:solute carrier family 35 member G1-like n=1 Tax=Ptychodera flava TaxID=63121 RepID=UPI00396A757D